MEKEKMKKANLKEAEAIAKALLALSTECDMSIAVSVIDEKENKGFCLANKDFAHGFAHGVSIIEGALTDAIQVGDMTLNTAKLLLMEVCDNISTNIKARLEKVENE